jgi:hypothetical protein
VRAGHTRGALQPAWPRGTRSRGLAFLPSSSPGFLEQCRGPGHRPRVHSSPPTHPARRTPRSSFGRSRGQAALPLWPGFEATPRRGRKRRRNSSRASHRRRARPRGAAAGRTRDPGPGCAHNFPRNSAPGAAPAPPPWATREPGPRPRSYHLRHFEQGPLGAGIHGVQQPLRGSGPGPGRAAAAAARGADESRSVRHRAALRAAASAREQGPKQQGRWVGGRAGRGCARGGGAGRTGPRRGRPPDVAGAGGDSRAAPARGAAAPVLPTRSSCTGSRRKWTPGPL